MNLFFDIDNGEGETTKAVIEIPKGSRNKYEYDKEKECFSLDRVLHSPFFYPTDYGFIPRTWYEDNDPLDIMVYTRYPTFPGCIIEVRVIGYLRMKDEKGIDDKLFAVPKDDPFFNEWKDIEDVPQGLKDEIAHFFARYKDLEKGKHSEVVGWYGKGDAIKILEKARKMFEEKFGKNKQSHQPTNI